MKIGTVGSGIIVDRMIDAAGQTAGVKIEAVSSRSRERAEEFARKHGIKKAYAGLDAMLEDPEIDTVYVASPNSMHYCQAKKALEAGKNVIVEKPFTSDRAQAEELFELAEKKGLRVYEAITNQYLPNYAAVRNHLSEIGPVHNVLASFCQYSSKYKAFLEGKNPNVFSLEYDGGALNDINVYNIHFVTGLFGRPESVVYYPRLASNGIDTAGTLVLEYPDFTATLTGAKDCSADPHVWIMGQAGTLVTESSPGVVKDVVLQLPKGDMIGKKDTEHGRSVGVLQHENHMVHELEAFRDMDAGQYARARVQTLLVMEVLEEAKRQRDNRFRQS